MEHVGDSDNNRNRCVWSVLQISGKKTEGIENQWKNQDHPNNMVEINLNTQMSERQLSRLVVSLNSRERSPVYTNVKQKKTLTEENNNRGNSNNM